MNKSDIQVALISDIIFLESIQIESIQKYYMELMRVARKIEEISIFGEYKQEENRVTAAFLQICKIGGEALIRHLSQAIGFQIPSSEIEILSQVVEDKSIPDGLLKSNFSFNLYVESKVKKNSVNESQMIRHLELIKAQTDFLLYLTPDKIKPSKLDTNVYWSNWNTIIEQLEQYIQNSKVENLQLLEFLITNFKTLLENLNILDVNWDLNNEQVLILAGSTAEDVALKYGYYICQNKRNFKPSRYISFFNNDRIKYLFEIIEIPKDDCNLRDVLELDKYLNEIETNYIQDDLRKVIKIKKIQELNLIINNSTDKNGNPCPYTYGQARYTTIQKIKNALKTSDLS